MAITFPAAPTLGQQYPTVDPEWTFDGTGWVPYSFDVLTQTIADGDTTHAPSSDAVFDALAGKQATISDTGWLAPTLQNSWANFGGLYSVAGYRKVGSRVILRGLITGGTVADDTILFTLPAGYVPTGYERFRPSSSIASAERIVIRPDGQVRIFGVADGSNLGISGIDFMVD